MYVYMERIKKCALSFTSSLGQSQWKRYAIKIVSTCLGERVLGHVQPFRACTTHRQQLSICVHISKMSLGGRD
jgi:hypothetical protein